MQHPTDLLLVSRNKQKKSLNDLHNVWLVSIASWCSLVVLSQVTAQTAVCYVSSCLFASNLAQHKLETKFFMVDVQALNLMVFKFKLKCNPPLCKHRGALSHSVLMINVDQLGLEENIKISTTKLKQLRKNCFRHVDQTVLFLFHDGYMRVIILHPFSNFSFLQSQITSCFLRHVKTCFNKGFVR